MAWCRIGDKPLSEPLLKSNHWRIHAALGGDELWCIQIMITPKWNKIVRVRVPWIINAFHITGAFCGKSTGQRWIPFTKGHWWARTATEQTVYLSVIMWQLRNGHRCNVLIEVCFPCLENTIVNPSFNSLRPSDPHMRRLYNHHWFRQWLVAWSAPSHYLNQWWGIVN